MKRLIEKSRYIALVGVIGLLVCSLTAYALGVYKTFKMVLAVAVGEKRDDFALVALFDCLDSFLVATAMLVLAISLYELFIGALAVPEWMFVRNLNELKAKFIFVIVPVLAVKFLQKLLSGESAVDTFYFGAAVGTVTLSLAIFNYVSEKEKTNKPETRPKAEDGARTL